MTDRAREHLDTVQDWIDQIEESAANFDQSHAQNLRLPVVAARQLRNLAEAVAACEQVATALAFKSGCSEDILRRLAESLRTIHQRLDDVTLPAAIAD